MKHLSYEEIKLLNLPDFIKNNHLVWESIEQLPIEQLQSLHFDNDDINVSIVEIIDEKKLKMIKEELNKLPPLIKQYFFDLMLIDRDITWSYIKSIKE